MGKKNKTPADWNRLAACGERALAILDLDPNEAEADCIEQAISDLVDLLTGLECFMERFLMATGIDPEDYPNTETRLKVAKDRLAGNHPVDLPEVADNGASPILATLPSLAEQVGGNHYKDCKIQPLEYILANELTFPEGNVVKLVTRHRTKGGAQDLRKAIHYLEVLLDDTYGPSWREVD